MNNSKRRREAIQSVPKGPSGTFAGANRRTRRHGEVVPDRPYSRSQQAFARLALAIADSPSFEDERSD